MSRRDFLLELARSVSPDQSLTVPAGWLVEALESAAAAAPDTDSVTADLTCEAVAELFGRKSTSTIRLWCERGWLPGCYRLAGREWRIPRSALQALQERNRAGTRRLQPTPPKDAPTGNLSDWRKVARRRAS